MVQATRQEAYMMRLVNAERAEAGLRPLRFDGDLNQSADAHSNWMLRTDTFSHTGAGGSRVADRVQDAGYRLTGSWAVGENLAVKQAGGAPGIRDDVLALHKMLMDSPGHRANILSGRYDEAGIGIKVGIYRGVEVVMITQNFGRTSADDARSPARSASSDAFDFVPATKTVAAAELPDAQDAIVQSAALEAEPVMPLWLDSPWSNLL